MITYPSEFDKQTLHFLQLFHRKLIGVKRDPNSFAPGKAVIIHTSFATWLGTLFTKNFDLHTNLWHKLN
mgnify:CR=1 FL=1